MIKLEKEHSEALLKRICDLLNAPNIIIVYGDHEAGIIDVMMTVHNSVDALNFGENGIDTIRNLLRRIDRKAQESKGQSTVQE